MVSVFTAIFTSSVLLVYMSQFLPSLPFSGAAGHLLVITITKTDALNFVPARPHTFGRSREGDMFKTGCRRHASSLSHMRLGLTN